MNCANCKHWRREPVTNWEGHPTGIPIGDQSYSDDGPGPRTEHGRCERITDAYTRDDRRLNRRRTDAELSASPAVVCDSEDYCAWLCTLPTFGCVLFEQNPEKP